MTERVISVAREFSVSPAGRYRTDGPFSGQAFREQFLIPALKEFEVVTVNLDETSGFGSSFLEEAFGGLIREGYTEQELKRRLKTQSTRASYPSRIWKYINEAATS